MIYDHGWNGAEKFLVLSLSFPISRRNREPPAGGGDRVALAGVRLLSDAELVDLLLVGLAVDGEGYRCHGDPSEWRINNI
jgi:hypothetical protein